MASCIKTSARLLLCDTTIGWSSLLVMLKLSPNYWLKSCPCRQWQKFPGRVHGRPGFPFCHRLHTFLSVRVFVISVAAVAVRMVLRNSPSWYFSLMNKITSLVVTQSPHQWLYDFLWASKQKSLAGICVRESKGRKRITHGLIQEVFHV